jgi:hypothetical protein
MDLYVLSATITSNALLPAGKFFLKRSNPCLPVPIDGSKAAKSAGIIAERH